MILSALRQFVQGPGVLGSLRGVRELPGLSTRHRSIRMGVAALDPAPDGLVGVSLTVEVLVGHGYMPFPEKWSWPPVSLPIILSPALPASTGSWGPASGFTWVFGST